MTNQISSSKLELDQVTLLAVTSVNIEATLQALEACQRRICFAKCMLLTHQPPPRSIPELETVSIPKLSSAADYSQFMLGHLADYVSTSHCLVVQWDGHVVDAARWNPQFLEYDYIGASWPQFTDGHDVGNGGFSLRSRRLLEACRSATFTNSHPEDLAIGRTNRQRLEAQGLKFAPREVADRFSAERASAPDKAFGFHGAWHMPRILGADLFWEVYQSLENRTPVYHDLGNIMSQVAKHPHGLKRSLVLGWHLLRHSMAGAGKTP
jgi:hypothetical protein